MRIRLLGRLQRKSWSTVASADLQLARPSDDEKKKNRMRVSKCIDKYGDKAAFLEPLDVQDDANIAQVMQLAARVRQVRFSVHSIAFADRDDLSRDTVETSRAGFKLAMDVSVYSLIAVTNAARPYFSDNASSLR